MASYYSRPRSPFYWIRYRKPDGSWGAKSSGVRKDTPGSLRTIHQMVGAETSKEKCDSETGLSALFTRWVPQWIEYKYTNEITRFRYQYAWAHLSMYLSMRRVTHPSEMTYALCHDYVQWRTSEEAAEDECRKPAAWNTAVKEMKVMGTIMQEALRRGWVIANPCAKLGFGTRNVSEKRAITIAEEKKIYKELHSKRKSCPWMEECFLVAMKQGCRLSEVQVPLDRIDTEAMSISFKIKGGRFHTAPLHKDLLPLVRKAREEKRAVLVPLPSGPSSWWCQFFDAIGLGDLCFHCTRVTVVTRLAEAGFSESQTMAYVGHSSYMVHALYRKMRPKAVASLGNVL